MNDRFKIYIEQLRDGHIEAVKEVFSPEFLEVDEKDLKFSDPVNVQGEVYLAEDNLVLHFDVETFAKIPCSICNEPTKEKISIKGSYHAIPLDEVRSGVFNFQEVLREIVLLETPSLAECNQGNCPQRKSIEKYLKKDHSSGDLDEGYQPFANLDLDK